MEGWLKDKKATEKNGRPAVDRPNPPNPAQKRLTEADGDEEVDGEARGPGVVLGKEARKGLVVMWLIGGMYVSQ
jgi:hypothetical protein